MGKFYVYVHKYASGPKEGQVFYVGKGCSNRHIVSKRGYNPHWTNISNKYGFTPEIVMRFDNEACAFSFERALIKHYGRENLTNLTDGGEGASGRSLSAASRKIISDGMLGAKHYNYNATIYTFYNSELGKFVGTCNEMSKVNDIDRSQVYRLIYGKEKFAKGWWFGREDKPVIKRIMSDETKIKMSNAKKAKRRNLTKHSFANADGDLVCDCVPSASEIMNVSTQGLYNLINGRYKQMKGWIYLGKKQHVDKC